MSEYEHFFTKEDEQFVLDNQQHILSLAKDSGIVLTEEAACLFVFLRTPATFKNLADNEEIKNRYELAVLLLTLIEASKEKNYLRISSGNISHKIQQEKLIKHLRAKIDMELSFWHTSYMTTLEFPAKNLCPLYSEEQVTKIANLSQKIIHKGIPVYKDLSLPFVIDYIVSQLKARDIFDKNSKYLKTNEASFMFDMLNLFGVMPKGLHENEDNILNNQEKFQKIKEFLRTIERRGK
ncbi:hypothetical protein GGR21_003594 [Dysgonomonas hofstadii]|uniref:Uncharacterized protein n=1 Tax=Dysgonomonas hofstadii TaxID=637886 RepID=A0A840D073_9BACT|nr:hypothetical protein [Dysgonomonas hofstadii]MBB4037673.1 hypothetical protein [Dysgonomonas hofstadii]